MSQPYVIVETFPAVSGFISVVKALVSTGQTITLPNYTTIITVDGRQQTNPFPSVATSFTGNVITITQANLTSVYIVMLVCGVR